MTTAFVAGTARVFELAFPQMFWSRRTLVLALVAGGPLALALVARAAAAGGTVDLRINGMPAAAGDLFGMALWTLFLRLAVPALGVFYGTALVADEVEHRSLTYLFTRPVRRSAVLLGKYFAYLACTGLLLLPAVALTWVVLVPDGAGSTGVTRLLRDLGVVALGLAVYGALFALMGAALRRPLVSGLVFAFGWEPLALLAPGYLRQFTIAGHLQAGPPGASLVWLLGILCVSLAAAANVIERRDYGADAG